jgi:hypothetical protein
MVALLPEPWKVSTVGLAAPEDVMMKDSTSSGKDVCGLVCVGVEVLYGSTLGSDTMVAKPRLVFPQSLIRAPFLRLFLRFIGYLLRPFRLRQVGDLSGILYVL